MTTAMLCDRIVIANDLAELRGMSHWIRQNAIAANFPPELAFALEFCANEAVANIISYAYDDGGRHDITLELTPTRHGAMLVIRDDGKAFNALEAPEHHAPANLAEAQVGGLGIPLMRRMMTHCGYRRENGINVLSLEAQRTIHRDNA